MEVGEPTCGKFISSTVSPWRFARARAHRVARDRSVTITTRTRNYRKRADPRFLLRSIIFAVFKDTGAKVVMDDFGTGYSSLSYLQSFPFDKIKVDRSFVADLETNNNNAAIVRAVISSTQTLNCRCERRA